MKLRLFKILVTVLAALAITSGLTLLTLAQQQPQQPQPQIRTPRQTPFPLNPDFSKMEVETLKVQGNVYMLAGAGGNIAVQVGNDGVLLVDTGLKQMDQKVLAAVRKLSERPIRTIVYTTLSDMHTGGAALLVKSGFLNQAGPGLGGRANEADLIANANILRLMTEIGEAKIPTDRWPPSTFHGKQKDFYMNDEPVIVLSVPDAVTAGDSMVWFRKSDVIATGEIFNQAGYPYIDLEHGGSINGILAGLNHVLEIAVPKHLQEGGTIIIPGYGRISDEHDLLEYRDMVTIIRDRVQNAITKGMTLQQVQAAKPSYTYEYDLRFGNNPAWTPQMFVEAIYKNLSARK